MAIPILPIREIVNSVPSEIQFGGRKDMAAIDKLYLHEYHEFDYLRRWSLVYYPELIFWMYSPWLTWEEYKRDRETWVKETKERIKKDHSRLGKYSTIQEAIKNLQEYYLRTANYECPESQAIEEVDYCLKGLKKSTEELESDYTFPVLCTPLEVDQILKWICPVPCVRKYLENQCGVSRKWEFLYRLTWRGKKHFR